MRTGSKTQSKRLGKPYYLARNGVILKIWGKQVLINWPQTIKEAGIMNKSFTLLSDISRMRCSPSRTPRYKTHLKNFPVKREVSLKMPLSREVCGCAHVTLGHSEVAAALVQGSVDPAHAGSRTWCHPCGGVFAANVRITESLQFVCTKKVREST